MNQRELSEKLEELAVKLEGWGEDDDVPESVIFGVAKELRKLSKENYAPGNGLSWEAVQPKTVKKQGGFISKTGRNLPF